MIRGMTTEFEEAFEHVIHDFGLNPGGDGSDGADMTAVGVLRSDCLALLSELLEDRERTTPELLSVIVQWSVATGVWLERARWQL